MILLQMAEDTDMPDSYFAQVCCLLEIPLLHYRGRMDEYIPTIISHAVGRLGSLEDESATASTYLLFAHLIYYNPVLTLDLMEKCDNALGPIFANWFQALEHFQP